MAALISRSQRFCGKLLTRDPRIRMSAAQALGHSWLRDLNIPILLHRIIYRLVGSYVQATHLKCAALKALSKALTDSELFYLRAQFQLLDPIDGCVSYNNFKEALVKNATDLLVESGAAKLLHKLEPLANKMMGFEEFCATSINIYQLEEKEE